MSPLALSSNFLFQWDELDSLFFSPPFLPPFLLSFLLSQQGLFRGPIVGQAFYSVSLYSQFPLSGIIFSYLLSINNTILFFKTQPPRLLYNRDCTNRSGVLPLCYRGIHYPFPSSSAFHTPVDCLPLPDCETHQCFPYLPIPRVHRAGFQEESWEFKLPWT